jgi:IclR family transcriptional regulator, mhp operon transcriptional activator
MTAPVAISALQRGLLVLEAVHRAGALSFTELQLETALPKATLARLLHTLVDSGWLRRQGARGRYVCETAPTLPPEQRQPITQLMPSAQPVCAALQRAVPWPINLGIRDGISMRIVDLPDTPGLGLAANFRQLGFKPPMLRSALGLCYLAFCPAAEADTVLQQLQRSRDEFDQAVLRSGKLPQRLKDIRQQGYALRDFSMLAPDSAERYGAVAVPVIASGQVRACLSCSWLLQISAAERVVQQYLPALQNAAGELARRIGHQTSR